MRQRCLNPNNKSWYRYGGRGISICGAWDKFENFYEDMGDPPIGTQLDRMDNDGNYEPHNCKWSTPEEQSKNRSTTIFITFQGTTLCLSDWAKRIGINKLTLYSRIVEFKWCSDKALTTPVTGPGRKRKCNEIKQTQ
jgi:hypothetical protein